MAALGDVNLLVALAWPDHVRHAPGRSWFAPPRTFGVGRLGAGRARFRAGFRGIRRHGGQPPQSPHVGRRMSVLDDGATGVTGGVPRAFAVDRSEYGLDRDHPRCSSKPEVLHPRDQAELARPPAETDQPAQIVPQEVDVLTNASLEVS